MYKLNQKSLDKLETCHPDLRILAKEAIKDSPYDFGISYGHRSAKEQKELYDKGRATKGNIVTYCDGIIKKSKHNYYPSLAFDIICYVNGKITWENSVYVEVGTHIMEVAEKLFEEDKISNRISWGGSWHRFKDWPHFQI